MDCYADVSGAESYDMVGQGELLKGLPQLSPEEKAGLDRTVHWMSNCGCQSDGVTTSSRNQWIIH